MIANVSHVNMAYYIPQLIDECFFFLTVFDNGLFLLLDELFLNDNMNYQRNMIRQSLETRKNRVITEFLCISSEKYKIKY